MPFYYMKNNSKNGRVFTVDIGQKELCPDCIYEKKDCEGEEIKFVDKLIPKVVVCGTFKEK